MNTFRSLAFVAALLPLLLAGDALANIEAGTSIAVLPLRHAGDVSDTAASRIADDIRALLKSRGANVLAKDKSERLSHNRRAACTSKKCLDDLIALCDARMLLGGRLTREGGALTLQIWLYDAKRQTQGKPLLMATLQDRCSGKCADAAAQKTLAERATRDLIAKARSLGAPAYITVQSTPAGGTVRIDGAPMGVTNMTFGVTPGKHVITVEKPGFKLSMHELDVEAGARGNVSAELQKSESGDGSGGNSGGGGAGGSKVTRLFAWITLAAAVGGLAAGIPLIAIDGQGT